MWCIDIYPFNPDNAIYTPSQETQWEAWLHCRFTVVDELRSYQTPQRQVMLYGSLLWGCMQGRPYRACFPERCVVALILPWHCAFSLGCWVTTSTSVSRLQTSAPKMQSRSNPIAVLQAVTFCRSILPAQHAASKHLQSSFLVLSIKRSSALLCSVSAWSANVGALSSARQYRAILPYLFGIKMWKPFLDTLGFANPFEWTVCTPGMTCKTTKDFYSKALFLLPRCCLFNISLLITKTSL